MHRKLGMIAALLVLIAMIFGPAEVASASRGGHPSGPVTASCAAAPNPVPVGGSYTVAGSGLPAGTYLNVWATDSVGVQWTSVVTDSSGAITDVPEVAPYAGTVVITVTVGGYGTTPSASCTQTAT